MSVTERVVNMYIIGPTHSKQERKCFTTHSTHFNLQFIVSLERGGERDVAPW